MVLDPEIEISGLVNRFCRDALKVSNARQSDIEKSVEKCPHIIPMQGRASTDFEILSDFESCDSFTRLGHKNLLTSDRLQRGDDFIDTLLIFQYLAHTDVYNNFGNTRHSHRILDPKLFFESRYGFFLINCLY